MALVKRDTTQDEIEKRLKLYLDDKGYINLSIVFKHKDWVGLPFVIDLINNGKEKENLPKTADTHFRVKEFLSKYDSEDLSEHPYSLEIKKGMEKPYCWMLWTLARRPGKPQYTVQALKKNKEGKGCTEYIVRDEFIRAVKKLKIKIVKGKASKKFDLPESDKIKDLKAAKKKAKFTKEISDE